MFRQFGLKLKNKVTNFILKKRIYLPLAKKFIRRKQIMTKIAIREE